MKKEEVSNYIVNFLKEKQEQSKTSGFVVGVSGGIDSALTSTLCAQTGLPVHLIVMPMGKNHDYDKSIRHINSLIGKYANVTKHECNLDDTFESLKKANNKEVIDDNADTSLADANAKSRLRMVELYYLANTYNLLVVGTGNKVEDFGVGFFTKYGDGGVDISPIGDLLKSEVKELAKYHNINKEILNSRPTDGLWEDERSDEDQLGLSYDEIEEIMANGDNANVSKEKIERYNHLHNSNKHKTKPIPVCEIPEIFKNNS